MALFAAVDSIRLDLDPIKGAAMLCCAMLTAFNCTLADVEPWYGTLKVREGRVLVQSNEKLN